MARPDDLFGDLIPHQWLPGETVFSLASRHHRLSGNHLASITCKSLFGHPSQGSAHDFPSRLGTFAALTHGNLGNAEQIAREHTILPFYLPFSTSEVAANAVASMEGASIGSLKFQLGLLTSRFRANHPLRACTTCMAEDAVRWGTAYWHLEHQLPGTVICLEHRTWLSRSDLKSTGVQRFQWLLPSPGHLHDQVCTQEITPEADALVRAISVLYHQPKGHHFDSRRVCAAYRQALRSRSLIVGDGRGRLRLARIGAQYAGFLRPLRQHAEFHSLPASEEAAAAEIGRLAYGLRCGTHPIRHLAAIAWLFPSFEEFAAGLDASGSTAQQDPPRIEIPYSKPARQVCMKQEALLKLVTEGYSVSGAARQVGVDPATGMAWTAKAGIETSKRPSVMRGDALLRMVTALRNGVSKSTVAQIGKVSIQSVTRLLRTEVGLRDQWLSAQYGNAQRRARRRWARAASANPSSGIKAARLLEPGAYAWLYRHDREWLDSECSQMMHVSRHGGVEVDWDSRDISLAQSVERLGRDISEEAPHGRIKLWQIYQCLPELKAKLGKLDRLPLTRKAICSLIRPRPIQLFRPLDFS